MRLIRAHIENFGKLSGLTIDFDEKLHIICEENGWGKSTLAAFVCAIFYGFSKDSGDRSRSVTDNVRKRYRPWQGGTYGGWIEFSVGECRYVASRVFGDTAKGDRFELTNAKSGRPTVDYGSGLGEELFGINRESFLRTVFIKQQDCVTKGTDDVQAKITRLSENTNDINNYETADKLLEKWLTQMHHEHKTGVLYKKRDEATVLEQSIREGEMLGEELKEAERLLAESLREAERLSAEMKSIETEEGRLSKLREMRGQRERYSALREDAKKAEKDYHAARERFPGNLPERDEIDGALRLCSEREKDRARAEVYALNPEEEEHLAAAERTAKEAGGDPSFTERRHMLRFIAGTAILLVGVVVLIVGILGAAGGERASVLWVETVIAVVVIALGIVTLRVSARKREIEKEKGEELKRRAQYEERELRALSKKKEEHESCMERIRENTERIQAFFSDYPFICSKDTDDFSERLAEMIEGLGSIERTSKERDEAKCALDAYEKKHDTEMISTGEDEAGISDESRLQARKENTKKDIAAEEERCRAYRDDYRDKLRQADKLKEDKEHYATVSAELAGLSERYRLVKLTREYLGKARDALSARYKDPVHETFLRYFDRIARMEGTGKAGDGHMDDAASVPRGESAVPVCHMDTDLVVRVEEEGLRRDGAMMSTGYQDLIGFCLRLALAEVMYEAEAPFLVMDDPFQNLDEAKTDMAMELLRELSERMQILYFTCHPSRRPADR